MAVINKIAISPPGRKVIIPIPLSIYRAMKAIKEIKKILGNTTIESLTLNRCI